MSTDDLKRVSGTAWAWESRPDPASDPEGYDAYLKELSEIDTAYLARDQVEELRIWRTLREDV